MAGFLHSLLILDQHIFYFFNRTTANPVFDVVMPFITNLNNWKIPILILVGFLLIKGGKQGRIAVLLIIPVLVLCDQMSAAVLKPWVARLRPCHALEDVRLLVGCGGKYGFPSSHATNIAGFAMLFSLVYRKRLWVYWIIAFFIGYSRVYVGVHYPLDVCAGWILGSIIALLVFQAYAYLAARYPFLDYRSKPPAEAAKEAQHSG